MLISDKVINQSTDLQKLSVSIQTILGALKKLQDNQEASIRSVQSSYDEQLQTINETLGCYSVLQYASVLLVPQGTRCTSLTSPTTSSSPWPRMEQSLPHLPTLH